MRVYYHAEYDADGILTKCVITKSSGYPELDSTTCAIMKRPGFRTVGSRESSVTWKIPGTPVSDAPTDKATSDVLCLLGGAAVFANGHTAEVQQSGRAMSMYYLGRVEAEMSEAEMTNTLEKVAQTTPAGPSQSKLLSCALEVKSAGERLKVLGTQLKAEGH